MTGLYNLVLGQNTESLNLLALLGEDAQVGRFRDAWVEHRDGDIVLAVYTRNGGGNRDHWYFVGQSGASDEAKDLTDYAGGIDCFCTGCIQTRHIPAHPAYLFDKDDEFDSTYCTNYFRVPDDMKDALRAHAVEPVDMSAVWMLTINALADAA